MTEATKAPKSSVKLFTNDMIPHSAKIDPDQEANLRDQEVRREENVQKGQTSRHHQSGTEPASFMDPTFYIPKKK